MSVKELWLKRDNLNIYGKLYLPDDVLEKLPLIVMSHGFTATHGNNDFYADMAYQAGFAVYSFDFCGGSVRSQSDGDFLEMSVLTEALDLEAVVEQLKLRDDIDETRVFLMGESQGAFVSAYVAGKNPDDIAGLILYYPAFVLQDDAAERVEKYGSGPRVDDVNGIKIGRIYTIDALTFDIYNIIRDYKKPVLIIHGDSDSIVPLRYSQKAVATYDDAKLVVLARAGHGFHGKDASLAGQAMLDYLSSVS